MKITQLADQLELYSAGDPPTHTLFVLERLLGSPDRLLLIDPPADAATRFELPENTAVLFTGQPGETGLALAPTQPGGIAHIRIGQHLLDVYSQRFANLVHFPALGILCSGTFGSDLSLPVLAEGSDGEDEIESLRLLARLVKGRRLQLFLPHVGSLATDKVEVMGRLAADVSYLHGLRRAVSQAIEAGSFWAQAERLGAQSLPENRRTPLAITTHQQNIQRLYNRLQT